MTAAEMCQTLRESPPLSVQGVIAKMASCIQQATDEYTAGAPTITDAEWDAMVKQLRSMEPNHPVLTKVGAAPTYGKKVKLTDMMGSLDKVNSVAELMAFAQNDPGGLVLMPKVDGLAVQLTFSAGKLIQAATRGDGTVGQDVTDNVKAMGLGELANPYEGRLRGEIYMPRATFNALNVNGAGFENPRNAAAGGLLCKDPAETGRRGLKFLCYDVIPDGAKPKSETYKRQYVAARLPGIEYVEQQLLNKPSEYDFQAVIDAWAARRPNLQYDIDGLVCAIDSTEVQEALGWHGKCPRGKIAFKFPAEQKQTTLKAIEWQPGRTGKLAPVAHIEPVRLAGATVARASLHGYGQIKALGVNIGDTVLIERAGEIIPYVVRVMVKGPASGHATYPENCPACQSPVELDANKANAWCKNPACPAKLSGLVLHWLRTLDVKGAGPAIVDGLCEQGLVKDVADLYFLNPTAVAVITGGQRSAEKLIAAIMAKHTVPLGVFLDGLGLQNLGTTTGALLAKGRTLEQVLAMEAWEMGALPGIGSLTARSIVDGLRANRDRILNLAGILTIEPGVQPMSNPNQEGPLKNLVICLTGAMSRTRSEIETDIVKAGGTPVSSVNKSTSMLVQADPTSASSKSVKAAKLGIPCISEADLMAKIAAG